MPALAKVLGARLADCFAAPGAQLAALERRKAEENRKQPQRLADAVGPCNEYSELLNRVADRAPEYAGAPLRVAPRVVAWNRQVRGLNGPPFCFSSVSVQPPHIARPPA